MHHRNSIRPIRLPIPEEFLPPRKSPTKQYTFAQTSNQSTPTNRSLSQIPTEEEQSLSHESTARPSTALADPDANSLRERLYSSPTPDFTDLTDDELSLLISHLKEYIKMVASNSDYDEARRSRALYDSAMDYRNHRVSDRTKSNSPRTRLAETQKEQEEIWQRELDEFDRDTEDKLAQLASRHETETKEFELRWQEEETLRKYRKPSSRLLQLSRREKFLARLNHFDEAEVAKLEAGELTRRELAMSQAMVNRDFHFAREKLKEKQQAECDLVVATQQHWRDCVIVRQKAERNVLKNRENAVEQRQKEPCRTREAQLTIVKTRGLNTGQRKRFEENPEISFEYVTVLPPVQPPDEIERTASRETVSENRSEEEDGVVVQE
jgi:hypothetical protein